VANLLACGSDTGLTNSEGNDAHQLAKAQPQLFQELMESVAQGQCDMMCDVMCSEGYDWPSSCTGARALSLSFRTTLRRGEALADQIHWARQAETMAQAKSPGK